MNITVRFGNSFAATVYTGVLLVIGWAIGSYSGYRTNAVLMLVTATIVLVVPDAVLTLLVTFAAAKILRSRGKEKENHRLPNRNTPLKVLILGKARLYELLSSHLV